MMRVRVFASKEGLQYTKRHSFFSSLLSFSPSLLARGGSSSRGAREEDEASDSGNEAG